MVTERKGGIKVTAANQSAENGHMLIDGNDIALFKIAFVPLIVKMKDHRDNLKRLIKKEDVNSAYKYGTKIPVKLGKRTQVEKRYCRQLKTVRSENLCQVARTCESYCRCCHAVACDVRAWFSPAASGDHDQAG